MRRGMNGVLPPCMRGSGAISRWCFLHPGAGRGMGRRGASSQNAGPRTSTSRKKVWTGPCRRARPLSREGHPQPGAGRVSGGVGKARGGRRGRIGWGGSSLALEGRAGAGHLEEHRRTGRIGGHSVIGAPGSEFGHAGSRTRASAASPRRRAGRSKQNYNLWAFCSRHRQPWHA